MKVKAKIAKVEFHLRKQVKKEKKAQHKQAVLHAVEKKLLAKKAKLIAEAKRLHNIIHKVDVKLTKLEKKVSKSK